MITIIPVEPLSEEHGTLIVEAFNKHFVNRGGQEDGHGCGYGFGSDPFTGDGWGSGCGYSYGSGDGSGDGNGNGDGGKCPEEWTVDESNRAPTRTAKIKKC